MRLATLGKIGSLVTITWGLGSGQPAAAERFIYRYRTGETLRYRASIAGASVIGAQGEQSRIGFRTVVSQSQRVRSVRNGVISLDLVETPTSNRVTMDGVTRASKEPATRYTVRMTTRGRFLSRTDVGKPAGADAAEDDGTPKSLEALEAIFGLNFPDKDLKPGDSWEDTLRIGKGPRPMSVRIVTTFEGNETYTGKKCARFRSKLDTQSVESKTFIDQEIRAISRVTAETVTLFDPKAGRELYTSGTVTDITRTEAPGAQTEIPAFNAVVRINSVTHVAGR